MTITRTAETLRLDLTGGLAITVAEKGYAASTIADIVTHARVSKRTFYEHFSDKEACLMALYEQGCEHLLGVVRGAAGTRKSSGGWADMVHDGVTAYLFALEDMPAVTRTLLVEIQAAGPRAYRLRQKMQRRFADTLVELVEQARVGDASIPALSPLLAIALVGGVHELMLQVSDPYAGDDASFTSLRGAVEQLVFAVLSAPRSATAGPSGETGPSGEAGDDLE